MFCLLLARTHLSNAFLRGISSDEKIYLRQKLLSHLREENDKVVYILLRIELFILTGV